MYKESPIGIPNKNGRFLSVFGRFLAFGEAAPAADLITASGRTAAEAALAADLITASRPDGGEAYNKIAGRRRPNP